MLSEAERLYVESKARCHIKKSAFIADYLLANGVVSLPCDFLQTVYVIPTIENGLPDIAEMKCLGFTLTHDAYVANLISSKNKLYQPGFGLFERTVFSDRGEAEEMAKRRDA